MSEESTTATGGDIRALLDSVRTSTEAARDALMAAGLSRQSASSAVLNVAWEMAEEPETGPQSIGSV